MFTKQRGMRDWGVKILGTGSFLPGDPITNEELLERHAIDTTADWIRKHTGIESRHWAPAEMATSHMAAESGRRALAAAGCNPKDLDRIILGTTTSDWTSPAAACRVQNLLGADCPAEDKQTACSSFLFALDQGARLIVTGMRRVLVIGADTKSRFVRRTDRRLLPILADGAGAVVLGPHAGAGGLLELELWSDGTRVQNMLTPAGGSAMPATHETVDKDLHTTRMQIPGPQVLEDAVEAMVGLARQVCAQRGIDVKEVDLVIPHQANFAIMRRVADALEIPIERVVATIRHAGNIVAGTVPHALDVAWRDGRVRAGSLILLAVAGAGYSGGAALYRVPGERA